jgi:hypothetical protein
LSILKIPLTDLCIAKICILTREIRDKVRIDGADTVVQSLWPVSEWHHSQNVTENNKCHQTFCWQKMT